jgi:hypothetical protein
MKLILAKVLKTWSMKLVDTHEVKPQRRGLVTGPNSPINFVIENIRQQPSVIAEGRRQETGGRKQEAGGETPVLLNSAPWRKPCFGFSVHVSLHCIPLYFKSSKNYI